MRRTENRNYLEYMNRHADDDYAAAGAALLRCLGDLRAEAGPRDLPLESDLLSRIGDMLFLEGKIIEATRYHALAEQVDPNAPLTKYVFAKFLGERLKDVPAALAKCDEMRQLAQALPTESTEDDLGRDRYLEMAEQLRQSLTGTR